MEGIAMIARKKKNFLIALVTGVALLLMTLTLFYYARTDANAMTHDTPAYANDYGWTPSVRKFNSGSMGDPANYTPITAQANDLKSSDKLAFFVAISDSSMITSNIYKYCTSTSQIPDASLVQYISNNGNTINDSTGVNSYTYVDSENHVTYFWVTYDVDNDFNGYVYFRREYSVRVDNQTRTEYDYYPTYLQLVYNVSDSDEAPSITSVSALMSNGDPYDGNWISGSISFTVVTKAMNPTDEHPEGTTAFKPNKELLFYSVDDGVNFIRIIGTNKIEIQGIRLDGKNIRFKVTNLSGTKEGTYVYGVHAGEHAVCMDPNEPEFEVSVTTMNTANESIGYVNGSWTCKSVMFTINNISLCYNEDEAIQYEISTGSTYVRTGLTNSLDVSTSNIRFRAISAAGRVWDYPTVFNVRIDSAIPNIGFSANTTDPAGDNKENRKNLTASVISATEDNPYVIYDFGYANGDVRINVFNRNESDVAINNASGTTFYYQEMRNGSYSGTYLPMSYTVAGEDSRGTRDVGYYIEESTNNAISVTKRYMVKIKSNAGLESVEKEVTVVIIRSAFTIQLAEDAISAEINTLGWIADKAVIKLSVPTDSKRVSGEYSVPTTKYNFYFKASNSESAEYLKGENVRVLEFHEEVNGDVRWWYTFDLKASADSTFIIYAENAAGKTCSAVVTDEKIRIDVLPPEYSLKSYIEPSDTNVSELVDIDGVTLKVCVCASCGYSQISTTVPERCPKCGSSALNVTADNWINGQIRLMLRVKEGVSGIYVKEREPVTEIVDGVERIVYNASTGEIVWQDGKVLNGNPIEEGTDTWYEFPITLNPSDNEKYYIGSTEYKYRIFTNSGKYIDVTFVANIDTSELITVSKFVVTSGEKVREVTVSGSSGSGYYDMKNYDNFSVCEDTYLSFSSSLDREGLNNHYKIRYQFFDGSTIAADRLISYASGLIVDNFKEIIYSDSILLPVEAGVQGDYYVAVYVDSLAVNYYGENITGGPYVIKVHYDTKNIVFEYKVEFENGEDDPNTLSDEISRERWIKGQVSVTISVRTGDSEGDQSLSDYTFYYIGLDKQTSAITESEWIRVDNGSVVENPGSLDYTFTLALTGISFKRYMGFSVCNAAGFRSTQRAVFENEIKIDNTKPTVDEAIINDGREGTLIGLRDDVDERTAGSKVYYMHSYYGTTDIQLINVNDDTRSAITYSYICLGQDSITEGKLTQDKNNLTELSGTLNVFADAGISVGENAYKIVYYAIYAKNAVNTLSDGVTEIGGGDNVEFKYIYRFVYDSGSLEGKLDFDKESGLNNPNTQMFSYMWKQNINLFATASGDAAPAGESEYVMYQFSVDGGESWYNYNYGGVENWFKSGVLTTLEFSPSLLRNYVDEDGNVPFEKGISEVFMFRARNKAGAFINFGKVYIAMEDTVPEFRIVTTVNGAEYNGTDLSEENVVWADSAITISIETTVRPASGITYMYYLRYNNGSTEVSTAEEGSYGKKLTNLTFSTDTLDGFNINRSAILVVTALSNSGLATGEERKSEVRIRIAVDQVVPEFALTGSASNKESGISTQIASGEWTNRNTVSISKSIVNANVSKVRYQYYITYNSDTELTDWSDALGSISVNESCVLTVIATSESGKTFTNKFEVNIDTVPPIIEFDGDMNVIQGETYYIDLKVRVLEANVDICEYMTIRRKSLDDEVRDGGFPFKQDGYILSTSHVDNSTRYYETDSKDYNNGENPLDNSYLRGETYRGYVRVFVRDKAGNEATIYFYVLPFNLTVNNLTLSDEDQAQVKAYERDLNKGRGYMEANRIAYFENLISRLKDRTSTLQKEITGYQDYLEDVYRQPSFSLYNDYRTMYEFMETFNDYEVYGKGWMQTAITGDSTSIYYAYYQNFLTQYGKLSALKVQVDKVEADVIALPAINMVKSKDYEEIIRVYDEYRNLTDDQRTCFTANLYNKLADLKEKCEVMLLADEDIGLSIDGDFAPGATINVTEFVKGTDTFDKAQKVIYEEVSEDSPRTIVSIYRVALDNEYAQTSASDIEVNLPILTEYRNYIYFSVYELSNDGSIKLVADTEIQPDGESVKFKTEELGTYILCTKTVLEKTDTTEGIYGSVLGLELTAEMIKYMIYIGAALFGIVLLVVIITGIRHSRFINSYNKAYRHSLYRKSVKGVPKGNKTK